MKASGSRRRGNDSERRAQKILEERGYMVHRAVQTGFRAGGKWLARSNDIFGEFDLLASRFDTKVLCIQVTSSPGAAAKKKREIEALLPWLNFDHMDIELWCWHPGRKSKRAKLPQTWTRWALLADLHNSPPYWVEEWPMEVTA